jgi:hypothetical protein
MTPSDDLVRRVSRSIASSIEVKQKLLESAEVVPNGPGQRNLD